MREIINYVLEANIALLLFLVAYRMLFRDENAFRVLRLYLLGAIVFSTVFPLFDFGGPAAHNSLAIGKVIPEYWLPEVVINPGGAAQPLPVESFASELWSVAGWVYVSGVVAASAWLIYQLGYVIVLTLRSRPQKIDRFRVIETPEDKPTFSFFNLIYIGNSDKLDLQEREQIIRHESVHARQLHSLDILLITVVRIAFWFNPFLKKYKDLLIQLHEFEADARAVDNSDVDKYCSLLARVALQGHFPIASHFNESLTVKRIEMMRSLKRKIASWKIAAVLAVVSGCFVIISCQDQLVDEFGKSTLSQTNDIPAEVEDHMRAFREKHPRSKLTYLEGAREDVAKFVATPEVKGRVVYQYSYRGGEKGGVLLSDVVQFADQFRNDEVFTVVEQQPEYTGGYDAMVSFLQENIKYPLEAMQKGESGVVYISTVIDENGQLSDTKALRGVSPAVDAEALRVVNMMPKWVPGKQNGKAVKVRFVIPIRFNPPEKQGAYYEVAPPNVDPITPSNYKMKVVEFRKLDDGTGMRFVGRVVDENGKALSGLNVLVEGSTHGVRTDDDGKFALETSKKNGTLILSYIGFDPVKITF